MKVSSKFALILIISLFSLSSCFDLKEKIYLKKDGSGTFSFTIDMSQSKLFIDMAKRLTDDPESSPTTQVHASFEESQKDLEKIKGIKNVMSVFDDQNYIYGFQFDFADINALNQAISKTLGKNKNTKNNYVQYRYSKGEFERLEETVLKNKIESEMKKEGKAEAFPSALFHDVRYITEYTFETKIKKTDHSNVEISNNGKTVTLTQMIFNENDEVKSLRNKIFF